MKFEDFFIQYKNLCSTFPKRPNTIIQSENSPYGDYIIGCKNVYWGFDSVNDCEDCFYISDAFEIKNCIDTSYTACSQWCHESTDAFQCYNGSYLNDCIQCTDCMYCSFSADCQNCFGSFFLKSKQYCFFNKQLTKDEYEEKVKTYLKKTPDEILKEVEEFGKQFPKQSSHQLDNENCEYGEYFYNNHHSYYLFDSTKNDDCAYLFDSHRNKNSFDQTYSAENELCYDIVDSIASYQSFFCQDIVKSTQSYFSRDLINCHNCFGSCCLKSKEYCILNKQYSPEEYQKITKDILSTMPEDYERVL